MISHLKRSQAMSEVCGVRARVETAGVLFARSHACGHEVLLYGGAVNARRRAARISVATSQRIVPVARGETVRMLNAGLAQQQG